MVRIDIVDLLNQAQEEEKYYKWEDAAKLYEQAAKLFLDKKRLEDAAKVYIKFGDICLRVVRASKTKEDYLDWNEQSVKAFNKAENYFIQTDNKLLSMECKAKALNALGYITTSIVKGKEVIKESINISSELIIIYSNKSDSKNLIKMSLLSLDSIGKL